MIVGGGPIGMEFAGLFATQGAQVTVIASTEQVFADYDDRIAEEARDILEGQGVEFPTGARAEQLGGDGGHTMVTYSRGEESGTVGADAVLLATGRVPATEGLGLEAAGVDVGEKKEVLVDAQLRTSAAGIWAAGDVHGGAQQTYLSYDDYRVLSSQLSGDGSYTSAGRTWPTTTFLTRVPCRTWG